MSISQELIKKVEEIAKNAELSKKSVDALLDQITELRQSLQKEQKLTLVAPPDYIPLFDSEGKSIDYTGKEISHFWFKGLEHKAISWSDFLVKLCDIINAEHGDEIGKVLELAGFVSSEDKNQYKYRKKEIGHTGIYMRTNLGSDRAIRYCRRLLREFGYKKEDIKVKIRAPW